eukprot:g7021.t1
MKRRPRPFFDEHKWALLEREQELERRRVEEVIRRLDAIEELRRRARERRLDREKRKLEFAAKLERCVLTLQRYERGRQARKVATRRALAVEKIVKWMLVKIRRAAMIRAVRNRAILRIMVSVEHLVEEQLNEARFFVHNVVALRAFQTHRSARIIQKAGRKRVELARRSAAIIVRATRCWLARGSLRRARIRRDIRRFQGSLSRHELGLKQPDPFAVPVTRDFPTEGRWWDTGSPAVPRPKWGSLRVENEEARSRQRALSLADLIRSGQSKSDAPAPAAASAAHGRGQRERAILARASMGGEGGGGGGEGRAGETLPLSSWRTKRWGNRGGDPAGKQASMGDENGSTSPRAAAESSETRVGFGKRVTSRRPVSMIDPRDAQKAALLDELERRHARRKAVAPDFEKLSLVEKHLHREREFEEQREKRRAAVERQALRKERQRAREIAEALRRKALEAELLQKKEQEKARKRLEKIREYKEKKAARELAARRALAAQRAEERRSKADEEAKRLAIEAAFEREKADRVERARRKRRAEEQQGRKRKDGLTAAERAQELSETGPCGHHRTKKPGGTTTDNKKSRTALAPLAVTYNGRDDGRKRANRAARSSRVNYCAGAGGVINAASTGWPGATKGSSTLRVAAGVRDGRRKPVPHGASVPVLPVVPGWKAMATGGTGRVENRKRTRRRPPKRAANIVGGVGGRMVGGAQGGVTWATEEFDEILKARNSTADLERLLSTSAGGGGGGAAPLTPAADDSGGGKARALRRSGPGPDKPTDAEENLGTNSSGEDQQRAATEADQAGEESGESGSCRREQGGHHLAGDESISMQTLDSIFPVPGEGAESGGGGGLGETTAPSGAGFLSPGWSSRSSRRSSETGETSSDALSDSAAIRQGKALLAGEPAGPASGCSRSSDGQVVEGETEVEYAAAAPAAAELREGEPPALLLPLVEPESESGAGVDDVGRSPEVLVQLPSAAFPDNVSDMSDDHTFIGLPLHDGGESGDEGDRGGFDGVELSPTCSGQESADLNPREAGVGIVGVESAQVLAAGRLYSADEEHGDSGTTSPVGSSPPSRQPTPGR